MEIQILQLAAMDPAKVASLETLPQEVLMTILFPFCDIRSLYSLSKVNSKWESVVKTYMQDFNKIVKMAVKNDCRALLKFAILETEKLERLNLIWRTHYIACSNDLAQTILQNDNLTVIILHVNNSQSRITNNVLDAIASIEHKLSHVGIKHKWLL